jgi:hypothetical protein
VAGNSSREQSKIADKSAEVIGEQDSVFGIEVVDHSARGPSSSASRSFTSLPAARQRTGWDRSAEQWTLRQMTVPAGGREGWSGPRAGYQAGCGVRCGSLSRLVDMVAGDAVRRGQVQAERRMKARSSTSSPMERP